MNTGKAHGSALGADEIAAIKKILGFDPDQTFQVDDDRHQAHPAGRWTAAQAAKADWQTGLRRLGARPTRTRKALFDRLVARDLPERLGRRAADLAGRPQGHRHPRRVRGRC